MALVAKGMSIRCCGSPLLILICIQNKGHSIIYKKKTDIGRRNSIIIIAGRNAAGW